MRHFGHFDRFSSSAGYYHGFGYHHGFGGDWITHMVISSVIHAMVYEVIFRLLRHLSLGEIVCLAVAVIAVLYSWNRNRPYRRW
jgi:hypothetical protein